jgi:hypothetical protein
VIQNDGASLEETMANSETTVCLGNQNDNNVEEKEKEAAKKVEEVKEEEEEEESVVIKTQCLKNPNTIRVAIGNELSAKAVNLSSGDLYRCASCEGVVSQFSRVDFDQSRWTCGFCQAENQVDFFEEEIPAGNEADYLVSAGEEEKPLKKTYAVFCVDVSGSMSSTQDATGLKLVNLERAQARRRALEEELAQFLEPGAKFQQDFSGKKNYVSRLECLKSACHVAISELMKQKKDVVPLLVTFANDVRVFNLDGTVSTKTGDELYQFENLLAFGKAVVDSNAAVDEGEWIHLLLLFFF